MNSKQLQDWIKKQKKPVAISGACISVFLLLFIYVFFFPNTNFKSPVADFYTTQNQSYVQIKASLKRNNIIDHSWTFNIAALFYHLEYDYQIGLFQIPKNSSNREILLLLTRRPKKNIIAEIRSFRKRKNVLAHFCKKLDIKYSAISDAVQDTIFLKNLGQEFNTENIYTIFIPDTIPVYKKRYYFNSLGIIVSFGIRNESQKQHNLGLLVKKFVFLRQLLNLKPATLTKCPRLLAFI